MTNEEINILINLHIEELEKESTPRNKRLIKALKIANEIVAGNGKGILQTSDIN